MNFTAIEAIYTKDRDTSASQVTESPAARKRPEEAAAAAEEHGAAGEAAAASSPPAGAAEGPGAAVEAAEWAPGPGTSQGRFQASALLKEVCKPYINITMTSRG